jgi:hypothetical protein
MIDLEENGRFADDCQVTLNQFSVFQGPMTCCSCMNNGTCIRCSCVKAKKDVLIAGQVEMGDVKIRI